jgi:predicted dehydrogenase
MEQDRRSFLSAAALSAGPLFIPKKVWGANDRITYGLIGSGGRGRYVSKIFQTLGARCVAVSDVYEPNLKLGLEGAPGAKGYLDYHDLLAHKSLDAVLIASPDHHHGPMLLAALAAGKDAYLEKPMSHSLEQSRQMVEAVRRTKQIVQIGMQRRSAPSVLKAKELVDSGVLGRITMVKPQWNWNISAKLDNSPLPGKLDWKRFLGSAKDRDLEPMRFRKWRYFWDYSGGNMTDQGTHLMDVTQWFNGVRTPVSAVSYGQVAKMTGAETPDVFCAVYEYPGFMSTWTLNYCNSHDNGWQIEFQGDKGTLLLNDSGLRVWEEPWKQHPEPTHQLDAKVPVEPHVQNFLDCVKSRQEPNAPVEVGASAVSAPHLANLAYHQGRQVKMPY